MFVSSVRNDASSLSRKTRKCQFTFYGLHSISKEQLIHKNPPASPEDFLWIKPIWFFQLAPDMSAVVDPVTGFTFLSHSGWLNLD